MTNIRTHTTDLRVELVGRVQQIGATLAAGVAAGERDRRLPDDTVRAIDESQLSRLWTASAYGGFEADVRTLSEVTKALAHFCPSTSWVVNNINGSNLLAARFPGTARDEVFGDNPGAKLASVFAAPGKVVRAPGGYALSGRWPYASGILHDDWAILSALETDAAGDIVGPVSVLVPTADVMIEDTWHTVGMRATGSHTVVAEQTFVPVHRVIPIEEQLGRDNATDLLAPPLFRSPAVSAMAVICASVVVGIGQAARDFVVDRAPARGIAPTSYTSQPDSRTFVSALGRTALTIDAAELHVNRAAEVIDEAAAAAVSLPETELRRIRGDVGQAVNLVTVALDELMWAHGAAAFAEANPLQQYWRDANTAARHAVLNPYVGRELYGGAFFGLDSIVHTL
jgi:3-hydroxy-9,10-secoandrosta-1,3,5(10)-triene-9,17-dione monooxygenase